MAILNVLHIQSSSQYWTVLQIMQVCFAQSIVTVRCAAMEHFYSWLVQPLAYRTTMLLPSLHNIAAWLYCTILRHDCILLVVVWVFLRSIGVSSHLVMIMSICMCWLMCDPANGNDDRTVEQTDQEHTQPLASHQTCVSNWPLKRLMLVLS